MLSNMSLEEQLKKLSQVQLARQLKQHERRFGNLMLDVFKAQEKSVSKEFRALEAEVWDTILDLSLSLFVNRQRLIEKIETLLSETILLGREVNQFQLDLFGIDFNVTTPEIKTYLFNYGARLITQVNATTKERIRDITIAGLDKNLTWSQIARKIRASFQLFSPRRAKLIAVTEIGNAYQEGSLSLAKQAGGNVEKRWITVGDDRVSKGCVANQNDGWIPINDAFSSRHQRPLRFPGCRCTTGYRIV